MSTNICRLCLQTNLEDYHSMEKFEYRFKMRAIMPEIDLEMIENPVVCQKCSDLLLGAYYFKNNCLRTNEELKTYYQETGRKVNLAEFLRQRNNTHKNEKDVDVDLGVDVDLDVPEYIEIQESSNSLPDNIKFETAIKETPPLQTGTTSKQKQSIVLPKCGTCNRLFASYRNLKIHILRFKDHKPLDKPTSSDEVTEVHKCYLCKRLFYDKISLDKHLLYHERHRCKICNRLTSCKVNLDIHMRVHSGERPFQCSTCGKAFAQSSILSTHIRTQHMTERPYVCSECGLTFPVRSNLTRHMKVHQGNVEKSFICNVCGKAFAIKSRLLQHMKRHTGVKEYSCQICSKRFVDAPTLRKHILIHNGYKPYECPICRKTFNKRYNMVTHQKSCSRRSGCEDVNTT